MPPTGSTPSDPVRDEPVVLADSERIWRRIPPGPDSAEPLVGGGVRPKSFRLKPRKGERGPSWSRASITQKPLALLQIEQDKGRSIESWMVAEITVEQVRSLGLDVLPDGNEEDLGHCIIVPTRERCFSDSVWSKLAKLARIIYTHSASS